MPPTRTDRRISARVRILLWLLLVMAVALAAVAVATRSILLRDVDHRINQLLTQETGEFANFVEHGVDPATGRPFTDPDTLLRVFLQRQYSDPDEELLGLVGVGPPGPGLRVIRQSRDIPSAIALHRDRPSLDAIAASTASSGRLDRARGEVRWAKVPIRNPEAAERGAAFVVAFHADRERAIADEAFRALLAISGVALLMTTGIGWAVAGRILAPVRVVRATAAELTERDLTQRIPVQGRDDIAALAETFNAMLDRLEQAFAGQRQFVDDAGHELRTPITIVRGHLELMGDDPAEQRETVRLVTDELDRMSRIVEDLLLLAKAERPDFVRTEPVQLAELTADVFVKARALGDRDWVLDGVADRAAVLDPQRITQAMVQLAQNAVQHTVAGQRIAIDSRAVEDRIELYVADRRPGVQESACPSFWSHSHDPPYRRRPQRFQGVPVRPRGRRGHRRGGAQGLPGRGARSDPAGRRRRGYGAGAGGRDRGHAGALGRDRPAGHTRPDPLRAPRPLLRGGRDGGRRGPLPGAGRAPRPGRHDDLRGRRADPGRAGRRGPPHPGRLRRLRHLGRRGGRAPGPRRPTPGRGGTRTPPGGAGLDRLDRIDTTDLDPRLAATELLVACNPYNVLCGERGVARVFGPQKGASPERVEELSAALERRAAVLTRDLAAPVDLRTAPGTGASGGLGAGLAAIGARLLPRFEVLLDRIDLDARLARADLVITAEGALDGQTVRGKIPAEVARRAKAHGVPVLALAGTLGQGAHHVRAVGVDAYGSILPAPMALPEALDRGAEFLADAAERALRMVLVGTRLAA